MKKSTLIFGMLAVAIVAAAGVACDKSESQAAESKFDLSRLSASEDITAFFTTHLMSGGYSDCFFVNESGNKCLAINSMDEFRESASSGIKLPTIDFEQYTLVIGQYSVADGGYRISDHGVSIEPERNILNLVVERLSGPHHNMPTVCYYWGLYSKLPLNPIVVHVIHKED